MVTKKTKKKLAKKPTPARSLFKVGRTVPNECWRMLKSMEKNMRASLLKCVKGS